MGYFSELNIDEEIRSRTDDAFGYNDYERTPKLNHSRNDVDEMMDKIVNF